VTVVADANVAIAALNPRDAFHDQALRVCLEAGDVAVLNLTWAEALIHPTRLGQYDAAARELKRLGFRIEVVSHEFADKARELRAVYGNKNFPMVDAIVVAFGVATGWPVVTCDSKWPAMAEARIKNLRTS